MVLMVTTDEVAGRQVAQVLGAVHASVVRARHVGSDIGAAFKTIVGGRIGGYEKLLEGARREALARLAEQATAIGADAILALRVSTSSVMRGASEILVYGTAVRLGASAGRGPATPAQKLAGSPARPPAAGRPTFRPTPKA